QGLGYPRQAAVAAMFSLLLVQDVFWEVQRNYSHTALLLALLPWTLICWLRLRRAAWPHFALFGLLAGLLILSKYNAAIFLLALIGADLMVAGRKSPLADRRIGLALAAMLIVTAPHLIWAIQHPDAVTALTTRFEMRPDERLLLVYLRAVAGFATALLGLLVLPLIVAAVLLRGDFSALIRQIRSDAQRTVLLCAGLFLAIWLALLLGSSSTRVISRWLLPVVVPLAPLLAGGLCALHPQAAGRIVGLAWLILAVSIPAQWYQSTWINRRSDYDYAGLARQLEADFGPRSIVLSDYAVFANLRLYAPGPIYAAPDMPRLPQGIPLPAIAVTADDSIPGPVLQLAASHGLCPAAGQNPDRIAMKRKHGDDLAGVLAVPLTACAGAGQPDAPGIKDPG
ncbi:glycosyltransferase family 39 protein, partial [Paracoccus sp. (in: a-proteobacteria)]|uniref:glycosyltransferase family 39 protein n=1 Tax=Paracoccus sp. TaxID=267 RepID=UPI003A849330